MKIAILTTGGVDPSGVHVVPCLLWLIAQLTQCGDEVHIFAMCGGGEGRWDMLGATVHNAGPRCAGRMFRLAWQEHRRAPFDVVQSLWSLRAHLVAAAMRLFLKVPMLFYVGGGELCAIADVGYGGGLTVKSRLMIAVAMKVADCVAGQSAPVVAQFAARHRQARRLCLGVALEHWPVAAPRSRGHALRLLHVAATVPFKDHDMMLATACHLKALGVPFRLDLLGRDISGDGRIEVSVAALGLSGLVHVHGVLAHCHTRIFHEQADILVVTSRFEAGPLVALEAALAGAAVVGTNVGHLAEWTPDAAAVVEPRDSEGLARVIAALYDNEDHRLRLAASAQARALAETADVTVRKFRAVYAGLAAGPAV
jgi:hypothetical protein